MEAAQSLLPTATSAEDTALEEVRPLDRLEDLEQRDLPGRSDEGIAAHRAPMGNEEVVPPQLLEDSGEEADREPARPRDVLEQHDRARRVPREHR